MSKRVSNPLIRLRESRLALGAAVLLFAVLLGAILEVTDTTHLLHKKTLTPPLIPTSESSNNSSRSSSNNDHVSTKTPSTKGSGSTADSSTTKNSLPLYAPYGDFVSNHHPNLSGAPAPSSETSVCNTTPGAACYIRFTKGASTTSLPSKTTDSSGAAYWKWDIKTANLSAGDWTITAVASLNGQTKSTPDQTPLSVAK